MAEMFFDVERVEYILGISKSKVYDLLRSGELKGFKLGRLWRVSDKALQEFLIEKRIETQMQAGAKNVRYPNEFKTTKDKSGSGQNFVQ